MKRRLHKIRPKIIRTIFHGCLVVMVFGGLTVLTGPSMSFAAPKTTGTQKTDKQCKEEKAQCLNACDKLIDLGDTIKRCKDQCTDHYMMCTPLRSSDLPGGKIRGMRPSVVPKTNVPIRRRGIDNEPPPDSGSESSPDVSQDKTDSVRPFGEK
jgi:hypothetical protein